MFSIPEPLPNTSTVMRVLPDCPQCGGRGFIIRRSPLTSFLHKFLCLCCGGRGYVAPFNSCDMCRARNATTPGPEPGQPSD